MRPLVLSFTLAVGFACAASDASAGQLRVTFPFRDAEYLRSDQSEGGLAFVPTELEPGTQAPLVVFLHGVNRESTLHAWLGGRGTPDLSSLAGAMVRARRSSPFILAGPSETRNARAGKVMWRDFDLGEFVDAVDASLDGRATVARDSIILAGHSGAGCNPDGGLLRTATFPGAVVPASILAIDTCLDADAGKAFGATPRGVPVHVWWERIVWPRRIGVFLQAYGAAADGRNRGPLSMRELTHFRSRPHEEIVGRALDALLTDLLPPKKGET